MPESQHGPHLPRPVRVTRFFDVPAPLAFSLLADGRNHGALVPMTEVTGDAPEVGGVIRAISGPFARSTGVGVVDTMRIDRWDRPGGQEPGDPPGRSSFTKLGPLLLGTADIDVAPATPIGGRARCRVTWTEQVHLAGPLPAWLTGAVLAPVLRGMLVWSLRAADPWLRAHAGRA